MKGVIMQGEPSDEEVNVLMNSLDNSHVIMDTTTEQVYTLNETGRPHVAFIDMGAKTRYYPRFIEERL